MFQMFNENASSIIFNHNAEICTISILNIYSNPPSSPKLSYTKHFDLPTEITDLKRTQRTVNNKREGKAQLETNITTIRQSTSVFGNGTDPPGLTHTSDHADNTEAEGNSGSDAVGKLFTLVIVRRDVTAEATLKDEVIGDADTGVDSQPIGDEVHEVLQDNLEVRISGNGNGERDTRGEEGPDETGNPLSPAAEHLEGQGDGVDVGAVVGDDGKGEDDKAELAESTEGLEDGIDQATVTRGIPASHVLVVSAVYFDGGDDGDTEEFGENKGNDQTEPGGEEDLAATAVCGLVDSVVGGIAGPACRETIDGRTEGQAITQLRNSDVHGEVDEVT